LEPDDTSIAQANGHGYGRRARLHYERELSSEEFALRAPHHPALQSIDEADNGMNS